MDREASPAKHNAEFSGKTVGEALESAAEALGLRPEARRKLIRDNARELFRQGFS